jgi:hypothetical protein
LLQSLVVKPRSSLVDMVLDLSHVLAKASELRFNVLVYKGADTEINNPDDGNLVSSYESNYASCKFSLKESKN